MMKGHIARGVLKGSAAAVNVSVGFVPDLVILTNPRGSAETLVIGAGYPILGFDSGSHEIMIGDTMRDATGGGTFTVETITLLSGSWAGGDAAGYMEIAGHTGTIANNNALSIVAREGRAGVADAATIDGTVTVMDMDIDTEAGTPAAVFVKEYDGGSEASKGFTLAAGALPNGEYVKWFAIKADSHIPEG